MKLTDRWMGAAKVAVVVIAGLQLTGCRKHVEAHKAEHPAEVQAIAGSELKKVTLTERAVQRLDVKTDEVRDQGGQSVVPYSSLIYDPKGKTWVYTNPSPRTFVRQEVEIDRIIGDKVVLKRGPQNGTVIASRAVAELYGTEFKVGH
jgi:hypothetical protein